MNLTYYIFGIVLFCLAMFVNLGHQQQSQENRVTGILFGGPDGGGVFPVPLVEPQQTVAAASCQSNQGAES